MWPWILSKVLSKSHHKTRFHCFAILALVKRWKPIKKSSVKSVSIWSYQHPSRMVRSNRIPIGAGDSTTCTRSILRDQNSSKPLAGAAEGWPVTCPDNVVVNPNKVERLWESSQIEGVGANVCVTSYCNYSVGVITNWHGRTCPDTLIQPLTLGVGGKGCPEKINPRDSWHENR
jgi:hypothetical protein